MPSIETVGFLYRRVCIWIYPYIRVKFYRNILIKMDDSKILDAVVTKCIGHSENDWSERCPVEAFTKLAWFIMSRREGVDIPTSPDAEEFWKQVANLDGCNKEDTTIFGE